MPPSTRPILRIPLSQPVNGTIDVSIQSIQSANDTHLEWWDENVQPMINQMPQRADRGWRWKRIMYGLKGVLFQHQAPAGFAVTFRSVRDPHGQPIVCGLTYAVRHYVYLGSHQQKASYLWYCASAPGKILAHHLTTHCGQPTSVEPREIGKIALDLTIQESERGGYHGRMGLHADPNGGAKLLSLYSQYGMTALPDGSLPPTFIRRILQGRGAHGYFYFDEAGALAFSQSLTSWR